MKTIPVDTQALGEVLLLRLEADMDPTGKQRSTRDGQPTWVADCYIRQGQSSELLKVKVHGVMPQVQVGPVVLHGVVARPYQFDGKSGISFVADSIVQAQGKEAR